MIDYREEVDKATPFREEYLVGFDSIIDARRAQMRKIRAEKRKDIFLDGEKHREEFKQMLGWPLTDYDPTVIPSVKIECLAVEDEVEISRCSFEVLEGLKLTGLLFKKRDGKKRPLVIVQHGGAGTPELISRVYGDTYNYRDMLPRVLAYDVHAFAPQLLLWDENKYGTPHDRRAIDAKLKSVGSSVMSVSLAWSVCPTADFIRCLPPRSTRVSKRRCPVASSMIARNTLGPIGFGGIPVSSFRIARWRRLFIRVRCLLRLHRAIRPLSSIPQKRNMSV